MIRVNLLDVERTQTREWFASSGHRILVMCGAILACTVAGSGARSWSLRQQLALVDEEIASAQRQTVHLRIVLEQVKELETRRTRLQQRVSSIEQLRRGQNGPVHMLDEISKTVPEMLWLTALEQHGADLTIDGRSSSMTALSDFVGNLERSTYFKRPVEIVSSHVETVAHGDVVTFSVKAVFAAPGS